MHRTEWLHRSENMENAKNRITSREELEDDIVPRITIQKYQPYETQPVNALKEQELVSRKQRQAGSLVCVFDKFFHEDDVWVRADQCADLHFALPIPSLFRSTHIET